MRELRLALDDRGDRSLLLWSHVRVEPAVRAARHVMAYDAIEGEPDSAPFIEWCRQLGKLVVVPQAHAAADVPAEPLSFDVVIVPGLAFTRAGERLGQGGAWYDRLLHEVRPDCLAIGVAFAPQLVDHLPTEPHDVRVHVVVTDEGRATPIG